MTRYGTVRALCHQAILCYCAAFLAPRVFHFSAFHYSGIHIEFFLEAIYIVSQCKCYFSAWYRPLLPCPND